MTRPMYEYDKVQKHNEEAFEEPQEQVVPMEFADVMITPEPEPLMGTIYKCNLINVRSQPSIDSEIVTRLKNGDKVHIEDEVDGWLAITTGMGMEGYCLKDYVEV